MSTRVLIKVSPCVWICKVAGLRSNHRLVFFFFRCFFRKAASISPASPERCVSPNQSQLSEKKKVFSCCVAFLRLNLLQTKRARQQFSLQGWTSGDENRMAVLKKKQKTYTQSLLLLCH